MHCFRSKKNNILPLYNKIVFLTRENFFYKDFKLSDSFTNRIYLIFFHLCFILITLKNKKMKGLIKLFYEILIQCINWKKLHIDNKNNLLLNFFSNNYSNKILTDKLTNYFDKFTFYIEDISLNSMTKGVFNFAYKE